MIEPRKTTPDDPEETLVTPRFDAEEAVQAQPVVPLDAAPAFPTAPAPASVRPATRATRHQWPLALVLVSALVGSVFGGAGLYLFQRQKAAAPEQTAAPAEVPQPSAPAEQTSEPKADNTDTAAVEQLPAPAPELERETPAPEPNRDAAKLEEAEERRAAPAPRAAAKDDDKDDDERRGASRKRGKKGDRDEELDPRPRRASRDDDDDSPAADSRQARRIDSIIYRPRRAERRRAPTRDRVRAIFEGQPE